MKNPWTEQELKFLLDNYSVHGGLYCADRLSRSQSSVKNKAKRLNIKSPLSKKRTTEDYIEELLRNNREIYPIEDYIDCMTPIVHSCMRGHSWKAAPNNILSKGSGCPQCSNPNISMEGFCKLYFISFKYDDVIYYKLGITNQPINKRFAGDWYKLKMELLWEINTIRETALILEKELLTRNNNFLINTGILKSGNTETFSVYIGKPDVI